jgi:long-chain acyl-CoA synthetase
MQLKLARALVFSKWHAALGGHVKYIIAGGAALNGALANQFAAAGLHILQGYGLTETSPVITYNRPSANRAGTVGTPMPGVEVKIADDGEIVTRGPHIMQGYYKNPEATAETIDADGWFHTGDIGEFTPEGYLKITDRKKSMFKLSTGKYVVPAPIESELVNQTLIEQAMVVGVGYKFCTALLFPNMDVLRLTLKKKGINPDQSPEDLCADPEVHALYQALVDKANEKVSHWESIKRFTLIPKPLTIEDGLLTPTLKVKRSIVSKAFADQIAAMYN